MTAISTGAFEMCDDLLYVGLPSGIQSIGDSAFYACTGIRTVGYGGNSEMAAGIQTGANNERLLNAKWEYGAIPVNLSEINAFILPDSVTEIDSEAFRGIDTEAVILPAGRAVYIGSGAFAGCGSLKYVVVPVGTEITYEEDAFEGTGARIVYP